MIPASQIDTTLIPETGANLTTLSKITGRAVSHITYNLLRHGIESELVRGHRIVSKPEAIRLIGIMADREAEKDRRARMAEARTPYRRRGRFEDYYRRAEVVTMLACLGVEETARMYSIAVFGPSVETQLPVTMKSNHPFSPEGEGSNGQVMPGEGEGSSGQVAEGEGSSGQHTNFAPTYEAYPADKERAASSALDLLVAKGLLEAVPFGNVSRKSPDAPKKKRAKTFVPKRVGFRRTQVDEFLKMLKG